MTAWALKRRWLWFGMTAFGIALDHLSKAAIIELLPFGASVMVTEFFNIVHVLNPGAAFSFLADQSGWQRWFFSLVAAAASVFLIILLRRNPPPLEAAAYVLVLAGALSNLIDRLVRGAVVDWLDFHWGGLHWPAFNLADVWITCGAALLIFLSFRSGAKKPDPVKTST